MRWSGGKKNRGVYITGNWSMKKNMVMVDGLEEVSLKFIKIHILLVSYYWCYFWLVVSIFHPYLPPIYICVLPVDSWSYCQSWCMIWGMPVVIIMELYMLILGRYNKEEYQGGGRIRGDRNWWISWF